MQPATRPAMALPAEVEAYVANLEKDNATLRASLVQSQTAVLQLATSVSNLSSKVAQEGPIAISDHAQGAHIRYRLICEHCVKPLDLPRDAFETHTEGAGTDYTGGYDSGYQITTAKCQICSSNMRFAGDFEKCIKDKRIFKIAG